MENQSAPSPVGTVIKIVTTVIQGLRLPRGILRLTALPNLERKTVTVSTCLYRGERLATIITIGLATKTLTPTEACFLNPILVVGSLITLIHSSLRTI
jgi:hypothetical protein